MKIGDTVTYDRTRETQTVQEDRRNATGSVAEIAFIDDEECARVKWSWSPDVGFWVLTKFLRVVQD